MVERIQGVIFLMGHAVAAGAEPHDFKGLAIVNVVGLGTAPVSAEFATVLLPNLPFGDSARDHGADMATPLKSKELLFFDGEFYSSHLIILILKYFDIRMCSLMWDCR